MTILVSTVLKGIIRAMITNNTQAFQVMIRYFLILISISFFAQNVSGQTDSVVSDRSFVQLDSAKIDSSDVIESSQDNKVDSLRYFSDELSFVSYLIANEQYSYATFLLNRLEEQSKSASAEQHDSITYMRGWIHYFDQEFTNAIGILSQVSNDFAIGVQARFYQSICNVYLEDYEKAKIQLSIIQLDSGTQLWELRMLQYASISLLERNYDDFDSLSGYFSKKHFEFATEEKSMTTYHQELSTYKRKSPWIAGFMSALFPGIGKLYAGYRGTPLGTMYMTLPLAAVAVEAALIAGLLSPPFFILGGIFGIFYIGNIWGSALSVYSIKKEIYDEIDRNILFDMHIPLRRVFWQ